MTSLSIIDDHVLLGQVLAHDLVGRGFVVSIVDLSSSILEQVERDRPDIVLLDLELGDGQPAGYELIVDIIERGATVIVLTGIEAAITRATCIELGAAGLLPKNTAFDELVDQIESGVCGGELAPSVSERLRLLQLLSTHRREQDHWLQPFLDLTEREVEILKELIAGRSSAEISEKSFVAISTVRSQVKSILRKLNVSSQLQAVALAHKVGWPYVTLGLDRRRAS